MLLKGEDLNQKLMFSKHVLNCGGAVKKLMQLNRITDGGLRAGPPAVGGYMQLFENLYNFLEKIAILKPFGSHFARF